jgi:mRNA-degrading endonuclease toxin of MazEF toxin-antitoxin module
VNRGDIYLVSLDPAEAHEQAGRRPVLVISPDAFNRATRLPVVLPITRGGEFARRLGFAVTLMGLKTTGIVRCDQPRALDLEARGGMKVDQLNAELLDEVMAKVITIFE